MAKLVSLALILTILCLLGSTLDVYARKQSLIDVAEEETFLRNICRGKKEKVVQLHFYAHDFLNKHPNATVFEVAKAAVTDNSPLRFGSVRVVDDPLTEGPNVSSRIIGRIQGLVTNADMSTVGVAINLNIVFTAEGYSGSTLSILGRNQFLDASRELPVVGGTGLFRWARGYAIQKSYALVKDYSVLEYTVYIAVSSKLPNGIGIETVQDM